MTALFTSSSNGCSLQDLSRKAKPWQRCANCKGPDCYPLFFFHSDVSSQANSLAGSVGLIGKYSPLWKAYNWLRELSKKKMHNLKWNNGIRRKGGCINDQMYAFPLQFETQFPPKLKFLLLTAFKQMWEETTTTDSKSSPICYRLLE